MTSLQQKTDKAKNEKRSFESEITDRNKRVSKLIKESRLKSDEIARTTDVATQISLLSQVTRLQNDAADLQNRNTIWRDEQTIRNFDSTIALSQEHMKKLEGLESTTTAYINKTIEATKYAGEDAVWVTLRKY